MIFFFLFLRKEVFQELYVLTVCFFLFSHGCMAVVFSDCGKVN